MKSLSCGTIVLDQNRVLLGHATGRNYWDIPKGGIEENETPKECAIRETFEETGYKVKNEDLVDLFQCGYTKKKDLHLFFYTGEKIQVQDLFCAERDGIVEFDEFKYVHVSELEQYVAPSMFKVLTEKLELIKKIQNKIKQVIIIRTDLNMRKGKMVAQGSHACVKIIMDIIQKGIPHIDQLNINDDILEWMIGDHAKIAVGVNSADELQELIKAAKDQGLPCSLIYDNGLTEFKGITTLTCGAIGPARSDVLDKITGHLKLL